MTSAWTDRHTSVALGLVLVSTAILLIQPEPYFLRVALAAALTAVAVAALATKPFGGLVIGLVGTAALILLKKLTGRWNETMFWTAIFESVSLLSVGAVMGSAGARMRTKVSHDTAAPTKILSPVHGSLGLVSTEVALARLEEELERAQDHDRPVSVILLTTTFKDGDVAPETEEAALRAVARLVESHVRTIDLAFGIGADEVGVILPEASSAQAWELAGPIIDATHHAQFADRAGNRTRTLNDTVVIDVGVATSAHSCDAEQLLVDVRAAMGRSDSTKFTP